MYLFIYYRLYTTWRTARLSLFANCWPCYSFHLSTFRRHSNVWMTELRRLLLQWWTTSTGRGFVVESSRSIIGVSSWRPSGPTMTWRGGHTRSCPFLSPRQRAVCGGKWYQPNHEDGIGGENAAVPEEEDTADGGPSVQFWGETFWIRQYFLRLIIIDIEVLIITVKYTSPYSIAS